METRSFVVGESGESCCSISFAYSKGIALSIASDEGNPQRKTNAQRKTNSGSQGHAESEINSGSEAPNRDETAGAKSDEHTAAVATAN